MPLTAMETNLETEKVPKKCADIQDMVKSPKTILDFFKTPEKPVISKQKSLLQYFTKPGEQGNSKSDSGTEKENASTRNGKVSKTDKDSPINGNLAMEKQTTKSNKDFKGVKINQNVKKKKKDAKIEKVNKSNNDTNSDPLADDNPELDDSEDSLILLSDSSMIEENDTQETNEKGSETEKPLPENDTVREQSNEEDSKVEKRMSESNAVKHQSNEKDETEIQISGSITFMENSSEKDSETEKQVQESNTETRSATDTGNSQVDSHQIVSSNEDICDKHTADEIQNDKTVNHEEETNITDRGDNTHEVSDKSNKTQGMHEEAVFLKPNDVKLTPKKTTMKCKDMMNLLKETLSTDMKMKKKSKRHKTKHKQKDNTENEAEGSVNSLKKIINEKRKEKKKVKFSKAKPAEVPGEQKGEVDPNVISNTQSLEEKNKSNLDVITVNHINETAECKGEKVSELNLGTQSDANKTALDSIRNGKQNDVEHNENKKQSKQDKKAKLSNCVSKKSKKSTSNITKKTAALKEIKEDCDKNTKPVDEASETKSISYEDFLKNLEKEPSNVTDEPDMLEVGTDSEMEIVNPELMEDSIQNDHENMDISEVIENHDNEVEKVLVENSENIDEIIDSETSKTNESDQVCNMPNTKQKPDKCEPKSVSVAESKSAGIARFFSVFTSTPGKPKSETESDDLQELIASPNNKKAKKSKNVRKLDKISSSNNKKGKRIENICKMKEEEDSNISQSDSIEIVEDTINDDIKTEKNAEAYQRKQDFLNSKSTTKSGKTTQAVLSFGATGLTTAKSEKVEVNEDKAIDNADDVKVNVKPQKTKGKKGSKPVVKSKQSQNVSDDSNVFETPNPKTKGRKAKTKETFDKQPSESEESCDQSQTDDSEDSSRRRSLRSRYKVAKFEMDEEKRTPIKLKLKRDKHSSSCDEIDGSATKAKKSKLTTKQSKAKALIDKAKKRKKKAKLKPHNTDNQDDEEERKIKKKLKKEKKKKKSDRDSNGEVVEHRRSSRLVGRTMASMEDVSLENIVILSDEDEEDGPKMKRKSKKTENGVEKSGKKKDNQQEVPEKLGKKKDGMQEVLVGKDSPKLKKVISPQKKTATPKKQGKLAPIFMGKSKPVEEKKPPLDPEQAKQRNLFLMSGVPDELKKQSAKTQAAAAIATDYPPLPTVSHVLQMPKLEYTGNQTGALDVWQLKTADLKLRSLGDPLSCLPMSRFTGDLINRQMNNVDLSLIKKFTSFPPLESQTEEACVGEVSCYNPGFPVNKLFAALKKLKEAAEQAQFDADDAVKTDAQPAEPEEITVIEDDSDKKKKRGRKSKLKLQKEEKADENMLQKQAPAEATEKKKYVKNLLWTDKYQPSSSTEVIGNSGSMKKLKTWLSEWKHILDREAKKARKLMMKKNKGKLQKTQAADDGWDEDSDFDMDSDDSDIEDTLCNTMLITGPHGSGKTVAVYALAQELGFKVHEVNASSSRNGKKILSQLQEATQSHQVSHQGLGTPNKNPATAMGSLTPKPAKMPTAFTNLFNKKKHETSCTLIDVDEKKSKKRKRESDIDESPKKKRSKKTDSKEKTKTLKPTFLDIDESSNGLVQGLNLSSTTMILFDEVDLVFEDDKGFLSAVQTFMATTKIPIILTTTRPSFSAQFDGRYETLTFKYPSMASLCSYLQLICLLEGLRVSPSDLTELLKLLNCDVRKCLMSVQFMSESGGSLVQTFCSIAKPDNKSVANRAVPAVEETIESSQDSQGSSKTGFNPMFGDNDDDDFVMLKPRTNRQRLLLEDDNSNSVDTFAHMFQPKQPELALNNKEDENAKLYPVVHGLDISPLLGMTVGQGDNLQDLLLRNMKMQTLSNLLESCNTCETLRTFCQNLLSNNLPLLLPLVTRVTDHVISSGKDNSTERKGKKRKRIQTDLYDSEASNDGCENTVTFNTEENITKMETKTENTASEKVENMCSIKALSAFSRFYDTVGMLDVVQTQESQKIVNSMRTTCGRRTYGSIQPGLDDSLPKFDVNSDVDCNVSRCYSSEVEVRSMYRLYEEIDRVQGEVEKLCSNNPAYSEEYVLPVLRGNEKFSVVVRSQPCQASGERRAEDNVVQNLPLLTYKHHRSLQLDYLPTLREISRTEHDRQIANTKRRFHHYFDSINLPLKDTTLNILSSTFT